jgi:hypothetical protein
MSLSGPDFFAPRNSCRSATPSPRTRSVPASTKARVAHERTRARKRRRVDMIGDGAFDFRLSTRARRRQGVLAAKKSTHRTKVRRIARPLSLDVFCADGRVRQGAARLQSGNPLPTELEAGPVQLACRQRGASGPCRACPCARARSSARQNPAPGGAALRCQSCCPRARRCRYACRSTGSPGENRRVHARFRSDDGKEQLVWSRARERSSTKRIHPGGRL